MTASHSLVISPPFRHNAPLSKKTKNRRLISVGYFLLQTNHSSKRPGFVPDRYLLKIDSCCREESKKMGQFFAYATVITVKEMTMSHNVTPNTSRVELRKTLR